MRRAPATAQRLHALRLVLLVGALAVLGAPPVAADHEPPPVLGEPEALLAGSVVAPPVEAGALRGTVRDCGFSVELSDGAALWVFCDSLEPTLGFFRTSTAALASADDPRTLHEPVDEVGHPFQLLTIGAEDDPCTGELAGQVPIAWPADGTRVDGPGGVDRVLISFLLLCLDKQPGVPPTLADYTAVSRGLARWDRAPGSPIPQATPITATVLVADLWPANVDEIGSSVSFGTALVAGDDGLVYAHRCGWSLGCQVARAPTWAVTDPAAWTYWNGLWWQATVPASGTVGLSGTGPPVTSFRIVHVPALDAYVMAYAPFPGAWVDAVAVRLARHPWGPFSAPVEVPVPGCEDADGCYSGAPHSQLSGPGHVGVSLFDRSRPEPPTGGVVVRVAGLPTTPAMSGPCATRFPDVDGDHPFCASIDWAADGALVAGYADGRFRPGATVSRQALAAWLWRAAGRPPAPLLPPDVVDVDADHPFRDAIAWALDAGVAATWPDGTFRPTTEVSRQAVAVWLWRLEGEPTVGAEVPPFPDVADADPFATATRWARSFSSGYPDGTFRPVAPLTRQAAVTWLRGALA